MKAFKIILSLVLSSSLLFSCLDTDLEEAVEKDDFYQNLDDADAAILGLYSKVQDLAAPLVVLNELRGDLMDVTSNASDDLMEISLHKPGKDNEWANVLQFYSVIQYCNDILYNFDKMKKENKLTLEEYNERYSDVGAIRSWIYYQLGVHYNKIPYITYPVSSVDDMVNNTGKMMEVGELVDSLILFMEGLPTLEDYADSKLITGSVPNTSPSFTLVPFFINKKCLLGDLYLFNDKFEDAARTYREVMAITEDADATGNNEKYRVRTYTYTGGNPTWFQIIYARNLDEDASSLINAWKNMFSLPADDRYAKNEMIWEMTFDYKYAPTYPFVELFANYGKGKYLLKPSVYAVNEFWGGEAQKNQIPYDARGISGGISETSQGEYIIAKYLTDYKVDKPFEQQGKWFLYRAALLHLRYAEAVNRIGYYKLASAFLNNGIASTFTWTPNDGRDAYRADSIQVSGWGPGKPYPAPFYFDARMSNQPSLRAPWRDHGGVRNRANLPAVVIPASDSLHFIEKKLVKEAGLELGFEGHRWIDLIRIARRLEKENSGSGSDFLREVMTRKYELSGQTAPNFSDPDKWYLNFYN
ncbi:RagB/SusD family nutrient uptake outer membrane protein [Dysgonomonas sp. 216]|uniref:RagB/SusD family nutrient uptake outer membrane protein n=1 Tax=Dysgonomonas sp. 216 TaxID=2302934 RepID=UPI0013D6F9EE|nr:RagB/SusD family nutrient uptake outer membrane protein [Dysgonomonas sp. 216]NDW19121.1 RagB/SusD family nutrient uptake outer membrane protein [Dysgonomonas sp. 216]